MLSPVEPISFAYTLCVFSPLVRVYAGYVREGGDPEVVGDEWEDFRDLADELEEFELLAGSADSAALECSLSEALDAMRRVISSDDLFDGMMDYAELHPERRASLYRAATRLIFADFMADIAAVHTVVHRFASGFHDCSEKIDNILVALGEGRILSKSELHAYMHRLLDFLHAVWVDDEIEIDFQNALGYAELFEEDYDEEEADEGDGFLSMPNWRGTEDVFADDDGEFDEEDECVEISSGKDVLETLIDELPFIVKSYLRANGDGA